VPTSLAKGLSLNDYDNRPIEEHSQISFRYLYFCKEIGLVEGKIRQGTGKRDENEGIWY